MNLATSGVRIEAPIPNKAAVGIEVPNRQTSVVPIRDIIDSQAFREAKSKVTMCLGKDIGGSVCVADISKMPHMLIAGATGSGKSVCINSIIMSILYKASPEEVRLLMVDPKVVELGVYNGIPHLLVPVVTDPRKAAGALNWASARCWAVINCSLTTASATSMAITAWLKSSRSEIWRRCRRSLLS